MKNYLIKRIFGIIPLLIIISFLSFTLIEMVPADPAEVALRVNEIIPTNEAIELVRIELGLDKPFLKRYVSWLYKSIHLDFGTSYINNRLVLDEIARSIPATIKLTLVTLSLIVFISIPIGVMSALYSNSLFDRFLRIFVFLGTSMPNYWAGLLLIWFFSIKLDWLPTNGYGDGGWEYLVLPSVTLSMAYVSIYVRLIRSNVLDNLKEPYVLYGRVRGLTERKILLNHVLKNSLLTSITALGMSLPQLLAGTVIIENIFGWPGIGRLCISAIFNRDYPVIRAYILMMAVLFVLCNLFVDVIHRFMDPRIKE